jgi:hypothetical protein
MILRRWSSSTRSRRTTRTSDAGRFTACDSCVRFDRAPDPFFNRGLRGYEPDGERSLRHGANRGRRGGRPSPEVTGLRRAFSGLGICGHLRDLRWVRPRHPIFFNRGLRRYEPDGETEPSARTRWRSAGRQTLPVIFECWAGLLSASICGICGGSIRHPIIFNRRLRGYEPDGETEP